MDPNEIHKYVISCNLDIKKRWDIFICILVIYNSFSIPFEMAFQTKSTTMTESINWTIDAIFMIDIFVGFRTSFHDKHGKEIFNS